MSESQRLTRRQFFFGANPLLLSPAGAGDERKVIVDRASVSTTQQVATVPTVLDLTGNTDGSIAAFLVLGYNVPGDGGGGFFRRVAAPGNSSVVIRDRQKPTPGMWALETFGSPLSARNFGARGNGTSDDTDALKNWLRALYVEKKRGLLPSGRYRVREGELVWRGGQNHQAGPWIETEPDATLVAAGAHDAPILQIWNDVPFQHHTGGFIGPLRFEDRPRNGVENRHGLVLSGVQNMRFAFLKGVNLNGDLVHIPKRENNGNPDPYHVAFCVFEGIESVLGKGWTFHNNNGVGFVLCRIESLRNTSGQKGAYRGAGAEIRIERVSVGSCRGWAIDLYRELGGTIQRFEIGLGELDGPEYGIRINGLSLATIDKVRFVHRRPLDGKSMLYHPRTALSLGLQHSASETNRYSATRQVRIDVTHRIEGYVDARKDQLGTFLTANHDRNVRDVSVRHAFDDNNRPPLGIVDEDLYSDVDPEAGISIRDRERVVHDSYPRPDTVAAGAAGLVIKTNGYGMPASKLIWGREIYGGPNIPRHAYKAYSPRTGEYMVPTSGLYRVRAQINLVGLQARSRVRMAVVISRAVNNGVTHHPVAESSNYAVGVGIQTYEVSCERWFARGDIIWISADQNSGAEIKVSASASNVFEVSAASFNR